LLIDRGDWIPQRERNEGSDLGMGMEWPSMFSLSATLDRDIIIFSDIVVGMQHAGTIHILCFSVTHFIWHASTNQSCSFKVSSQCPFLAQNRGNCNYAEDISIFLVLMVESIHQHDACIFLDLYGNN
jgi:hypothetical protein